MPDKAGGFSPEWFAAAAEAEIIRSSTVCLERVETDSRSAGPGALFVALKGERVDGHDYLRAALESGAEAALVSRAWRETRGAAELAALGARPGRSLPAIICAPDPLAALQRAAKAWRCGFPSLRRIGVTGSSGKTTVKELIASILSVSHSVVKNPGNLNSDIGLPASLFAIRPRHELAVFELGINRIGEMDLLAEVYEPDCALINTIGSAHIGLLGGSREGIATEKKKISSRFNGRQTLVVREDDEFRDFLIKDVRGDVAFFGLRSMERFEGARSLGLGGWELRYAGLPMRLALPGAHNLSNALASIRVAELFGVDPGDIAAGLEAQAPLSGRGEILCGPVCIVNDCYNANAESTLAALSFCDEAELPGRRIYVLGSMKELGTESEAAHRRVGAAAAESRADALFFLGEEARWAYLEASARRPDSSETRHYERFEDLSSALKSFVREGDTVLLKASRSMALERLIDVLNVRGGTNAS